MIMLLDISDDDVRGRFANVQLTIPGEETLIQRIAPALRLWERKLVSDIIPAEMIAVSDVAPLCIDIVIFGALHDSLPMLDVVLTPNGMATVGNQNLVPASSARSEAARKSLAGLLFKSQEALLLLLRTKPQWRDSLQGLSFAQSLFHSLDELCRLSPGSSDLSFGQAMEMRTMAAHTENRFARTYISYGLLSRLRHQALAGNLDNAAQFVVRRIKEAVSVSLRSGGAKGETLIDVVDFIRNRPDEFPEWHTSPLARVFSDQSFKNDPGSGGFFF